MLDETRSKYESMFNTYKNRKANQLTMYTKRDGTRNLTRIFTARDSHANTDVTSHAMLKSPHATIDHLGKTHGDEGLMTQIQIKTLNLDSNSLPNGTLLSSRGQLSSGRRRTHKRNNTATQHGRTLQVVSQGLINH